jgi:hypothetical protein
MFVASLMRLVSFACLRPSSNENDEIFLTEVYLGLAFSHNTLGL